MDVEAGALDDRDGHPTQTLEPASENLPAEQVEHPVRPALALLNPAGHGWHRRDPERAVYCPGRHCRHLAVPNSFEYEPGAHGSMGVAPPAHECPNAHLSSPAVPGGMGTHDVEPSTSL